MPVSTTNGLALPGKWPSARPFSRRGMTIGRVGFFRMCTGGAAFKAGIQPGDILVRVSDEEIRPPNLPLFPLGEATAVDIKRRDAPT